MTANRVTFVRRALLGLAMLAGVWAMAIAVTGGFALGLGNVRLSSRNVRNPLLIALLTAGASLALSHGRDLARDAAWWWSLVQSAGRTRVLRWWARWIGLPGTVGAGGATLLIVHWARARPLWLDEQMIALNVRDRAVADLTGPLWLNQSAPFGWLATERAALLLLGQSEPAVRAMPVVFGVLTLAVAAWAARRWMTVPGGAALVLLLSVGRWVFHYALESKHYSADAFFGLLLPALLVWVLEGGEEAARARRATVWWSVSAAGLWWANGALFVTPACALLLAIGLWHLDGTRIARTFAVCAAVWLASFGLHYLAALRFTIANADLAAAWSFALPPASAHASERLAWLAGQVAPFADRPGGTGLAALFWVATLGGSLLARPRLLGWAAAITVLSAFALAAVGLVPLYERLSLWALPASYLAAAFCVDAGVRWTRAPSAYRRGAGAAAGVLLVGALWLCLDITRRGWRDMREGRPRETNHQLDDRTAVRWLVAQARPGDAMLTTALALPAVWWYGRVPLSAPTAGAALSQGNPILEVSYRPPGPECDTAALGRALVAHTRALVYFGFRFDDVPAGFDDLLLDELEQIGQVVETQRFAGLTRAVIVERDGVQGAAGPAASSSRDTRLDGCVSVRPAIRW